MYVLCRSFIGCRRHSPSAPISWPLRRLVTDTRTDRVAVWCLQVDWSLDVHQVTLTVCLWISLWERSFVVACRTSLWSSNLLQWSALHADHQATGSASSRMTDWEIDVHYTCGHWLVYTSSLVVVQLISGKHDRHVCIILWRMRARNGTRARKGRQSVIQGVFTAYVMLLMAVFINIIIIFVY